MPVDGDAAGAPGGGSARLLGVPITLDAGHQEQHVVPVAHRHWERRDFLLADHRAEHRRLRIEERGDPFDDHAFAHAADRECDVELRALSHLQPDGLCDGLKSGRADLDEPFARDQAGHLIGSAIGRLDLALDAAREGRELDQRGGHNRAAGVMHDAGQRGAIDLRGRGSRDQKNEQ